MFKFLFFLSYFQGLNNWGLFSLYIYHAHEVPGVEETVELHTYDSLGKKPHLVDRRGNQSEDVYVANDIVKTDKGNLHTCLVTFYYNL